ncbi:MAG: hypothetical protein ACE5I2_14995 [Anaerolineae bacterium]
MRTLGKPRKPGILFLFLFVSSGFLSAGYHSKTQQVCGPSARIDIVPTLPTQDDDVQVIASGDWYDTCIPFYQSHLIDNNLIRVDAIVDYPAGTGCADMITPWEFMVDVGKLPAGSYEVNLYITDVFNQVPIPTTLCATKHFTVFPELNKTYLPIIAKQITAK